MKLVLKKNARNSGDDDSLVTVLLQYIKMSPTAEMKYVYVVQLL